MWISGEFVGLKIESDLTKFRKRTRLSLSRPRQGKTENILLHLLKGRAEGEAGKLKPDLM